MHTLYHRAGIAANVHRGVAQGTAACMEGRGGERGFSLVEVLLAAAIAAIATTVLVTLAHHLARATRALDDRLQGSSAAHVLLDRLEGDSQAAWAVWVPPLDVEGDDNRDGHEVDFFAQDASHRGYAWAYRFDAAAHAVTRYAYAAGSAPLSGVTYRPIDAFSATTSPAGAIGNRAAAAYDPLFASARVDSYAYDYGTPFGAIGGNAITRVRVVTAGADLATLLASATAPSHFTVVVTYTPPPAPLGTPIPTPLPLAPFGP